MEEPNVNRDNEPNPTPRQAENRLWFWAVQSVGPPLAAWADILRCCFLIFFFLRFLGHS
jgi:hypothetical protein